MAGVSVNAYRKDSSDRNLMIPDSNQSVNPPGLTLKRPCDFTVYRRDYWQQLVPQISMDGSYTNAPGGPPNIHGYLLSQGAFTEVQYPGYMGTIAQRITPTGDIYGCNHNTDFTTSMHGFVRTAAGYAQLDVPASMSNGATPDGRIVVGLYTDLSTGLTHGYFVRSGNFEPFDVPGSTLTQAYDMNPGGVVVGNFRDTAGTQHGFRLSAGGFTTIDYPGATGTQARGINPGGDIVGFYVDSSGKTHGFLAVPTLERD